MKRYFPKDGTVSSDRYDQETGQEQQPRAVCPDKALPFLCSMSQIEEDGVLMSCIFQHYTRGHGDNTVKRGVGCNEMEGGARCSPSSPPTSHIPPYVLESQSVVH